MQSRVPFGPSVRRKLFEFRASSRPHDAPKHAKSMYRCVRQRSATVLESHTVSLTPNRQVCLLTVVESHAVWSEDHSVQTEVWHWAGEPHSMFKTEGSAFHCDGEPRSLPF